MKSTLIIAAIVATVLVSASAVPAAAKNNNGSFNQSAEGNKHLESYCKLAKTAFAHDVRKLNNATPGTQEHADARTIANETLGNAWAAGCSWAQ